MLSIETSSRNKSCSSWTCCTQRLHHCWLRVGVVVLLILAASTCLLVTSVRGQQQLATSLPRSASDDKQTKLSRNQRVQMARQRVQVHRVEPSSSLYCGLDHDEEDRGCWEPNDLEGQWVEQSNNRSNECPGWNFGSVCENGAATNVQCTNGYHDDFVWQAEGLATFNATTTCALLGNRTVLMIGDSTMGQTAATLMNRLREPGGGCEGQILFRLSDTLVMQDLGRESLPAILQQQRRQLMNRGVHWSKAVNTTDPDIVVFGLGPHIYGETRWRDAFESVVEGLRAHQDLVWREQQHMVHIVYKTNQPGGCSNTIAPLPPDEAARTFSKYRYNHAEFYGRDRYAIARLHLLGVPVMDLRMLYSRTDSHPGGKDCLHLCTPGPLDVSADLFQDMLVNELAIVYGKPP